MLPLQSSNREVQTVVIGAGFYGLSVALFLRDELGLSDILVIEKEPDAMLRASYVNQARVHNGYHYPRSVLTGFRSAYNFPKFVEDYKSAIVNDFEKYYGVAKILSKVNAKQFKRFSEKIGVDIEDAEERVTKYFNNLLVEEVFRVKEYAFDSRKLRNLLMKRIHERPGIILHFGESVERIMPSGSQDYIQVETSRATYNASYVLNCTYSQINNVHRKSRLPLLGFRHEIAEMCLVELPSEFKKFSITMMDGPFFSIMPFPSKNLHTLSHVRYTPHESWEDNDITPTEKHHTHDYFSNINLRSNFKKMYADVVRYIPSLKDMKYVESISEVKTTLLKSESDDSRPILFRSDFGLRGYACIMGGKLDNVYDVFDELKVFYGKG